VGTERKGTRGFRVQTLKPFFNTAMPLALAFSIYNKQQLIVLV
jgi:hypothetical protein